MDESTRSAIRRVESDVSTIEGKMHVINSSLDLESRTRTAEDNDLRNRVSALETQVNSIASVIRQMVESLSQI